MLYRTHLVFAIFVGLLVVGLFESWLAFFIGLFFGAWVPDRDLRFRFFVKHRGFMHSFVFGLLIAVFLVVLNYDLGVGFLLGYVLHLMADGMSVEGLRLWPFGFRVRGVVRVGGVLENVVFWVLVLGVVLEVLMVVV